MNQTWSWESSPSVLSIHLNGPLVFYSPPIAPPFNWLSPGLIIRSPSPPPRSFPRFGTPSLPPSIPFPPEILRPSCIPEPCLALRGVNHLGGYSSSRPLSPEISSARLSTVRARHPHPRVRLSIFIRFILGIVVVLFFQCMATLFNPTYRRGEGINWGLLSYTMVMFALATGFTATNLTVVFISLFETGFAQGGVLGSQMLAGPPILRALRITPSLMFLSISWLADGLLVSSLFDAGFAYRASSTATPPLAVSLLRDLCPELLDHRLTIRHVHRLFRCAFELSTSRWRCLGLISSS